MTEKTEELNNQTAAASLSLHINKARPQVPELHCDLFKLKKSASIVKNIHAIYKTTGPQLELKAATLCSVNKKVFSFK